MKGEFKAIETVWKGCRFRSRLEARWSVWLDSLGIKWEYEPEGFHLDGECYLPDFFLPIPARTHVDPEAKPVPWDGWRNCQAYWLEIKPCEPTEQERKLMLALAKHTKHHVFCFAGNCGIDEVTFWIATIQGKWINLTADAQAHAVHVNEIRREMELPPRPHSSVEEIYVAIYGFLDNLGASDGDLADAFQTARSARWEHGERPKI